MPTEIFDLIITTKGNPGKKEFAKVFSEVILLMVKNDFIEKVEIGPYPPVK